MDCHKPTLPRRQLALGGLLLLAQASIAHTENAQPTPIIRAFRNDAALNAIAFADRSSGWSVGDRGVIWHTSDAGATWRQQPSPVSCTLNGLFFIDGRRGWAIGGQCQPYSNATRGV